MKLYMAPRAPNPRRVGMFLLEKGITDFPIEDVDLNGQAHKTDAFRAKSALSKVPTLELDDGRCLSESRAICTWLEGHYPEPNLMGVNADERAFIEEADRRMELYLFLPLALCIRHTHPGLAPLENPQLPEFGRVQGERGRATAQWLDGVLARQAFVAGDRFTIADITAFCALEFARGLIKFVPGNAGMPHLQAWRDRMAQRPSAKYL